MIETLAAVVSKAAFPLMGGAWAITVCEGDWLVAAVAIPPVVACAAFAWKYPGRLRGKCGEASA